MPPMAKDNDSEYPPPIGAFGASILRAYTAPQSSLPPTGSDHKYYRDWPTYNALIRPWRNFVIKLINFESTDVFRLKCAKNHG